MAFSEEVVAQAWDRADYKCECQREIHFHGGGRCNKKLVLGNRGREGPDAWEAHHIIPVDSGGSDTLSNCKIFCWECHGKTF